MKRLVLVLVALSMVASVVLAAKGDKGKGKKRKAPDIRGIITKDVVVEGSPETVSIEMKVFAKKGEKPEVQTVEVPADVTVKIGKDEASVKDLKAKMRAMMWKGEDGKVKLIRAMAPKARGPKKPKKPKDN